MKLYNLKSIKENIEYSGDFIFIVVIILELLVTSCFIIGTILEVIR